MLGALAALVASQLSDATLAGLAGAGSVPLLAASAWAGTRPDLTTTQQPLVVIARTALDPGVREQARRNLGIGGGRAFVQDERIVAIDHHRAHLSAALVEPMDHVGPCGPQPLALDEACHAN